MATDVYVIAEVGINHEGDVGICREMIAAVASTGANAVKLQTIDPDANYVVGTESHALFKQAELTRDETYNLFEYGKSCKLEVFTTVGDLNTLDWVIQLQPDAWKISSGLITNIPLIEEISKRDEKVFLSTGLATINEIDAVVEIFRAKTNRDFALLHCITEYPVETANLNLARISYLRARYNCPIGFSDHSIGVAAATVAVGAGATAIEKHFSFDVTRKHFDHAISLETDDFRILVENVRSAASMLGDGNENLSSQLKDARLKFLRTIVATQPINVADEFTKENVGIKRPIHGQHGLPPKYFEQLMGRPASMSYNENDPIIESLD
jgi:sialic acid synthase SpsE